MLYGATSCQYIDTEPTEFFLKAPTENDNVV